ncbi:Nramp family divalent metal transporter [Saxibacter everestensis]|uniref:Nramp family divalent metal transporter n=1 Tax=Saxibacter everestensis TaxID=2909229 RepID=A0ABY8QP61_9MICO|nr:Nramp family divalent metal transporter [Brevibacteriaceae bacterium ZFBP1038]
MLESKQRPPGQSLRARMTRFGLLGPAFIAAIAYVDPGNFATNFAAGAQHGYLLLWVVVCANLMGMVVQYLAAKLGTVSGKSMPELIRDNSPRWLSRGLWLQAEAVAIATDLAEVIGGALALQLLFGLPIVAGVLLTGTVGLLVLALSDDGRRRFEYTILGMLLIILIGLGYGLFAAGFAPAAAVQGLVPRFADTSSIMLATGILGATLMPHVVYLHSGLPQSEPSHDIPATTALRLRRHRVNVIAAMSLAGVVNAGMLLMAASLGTRGGASQVLAAGDDLGAIHGVIGSLIGPLAAVAFAIALLASGLASTSVGTYAGQIIMQGFIRRRIPLLFRRCLTLIPAMALLLLGTSPTDALIWSQVVLSFGIPFAIIPLVLLTARRKFMGSFVNRRLLTITSVVIAAGVLTLNTLLIKETFWP